MTPEIQLSNGLYYNFYEPDPDAVTIEVIAHALSHIGRFTGHTYRFYSVAEHCWRASFIGPEDEALERLMHDAGEALVTDIATPLKRQLGPEIIKLETIAEEMLAAKFGYRFPYPPSVKHADLVMLWTEKRDLMPDGGKPWTGVPEVEPLHQRIPLRGEPPVYWRQAFLDRFEELAR